MEKRRLTVVHIDDDAGDALLVRRNVELIPTFQVDYHHIATADEALRHVVDHEVSVLLLDYYLADANGLALLRQIREAGVETPAIFLTGQDDQEVTVEIMRAGAEDYLAKSSLSPRSLERAITNAVNQAELRAELVSYQASIEQTAEELARKNAEIRSFHHVMSHELKNPLTAAYSFLSLLLDDLAGPLNEEQREYVQIVLNSCEQIRICIDDLLDASRIETGKLSVNAEPASLVEHVESVTASLRPMAQHHGVQLTASAQLDLPFAIIDGPRMVQVLTNLINNAIKFTASGGEISVHLEADGDDKLRVRISDTGRGIPADMLDKIFERHVQVDPSDSSRRGGLGIGLTLCKEIVKLHGGAIWVESEPGRGSDFYFTVPTADEAAISRA